MLKNFYGAKIVKVIRILILLPMNRNVFMGVNSQNICFFSIRTLTRDGLLTDNAVYENAIRKIMLSRSRKKVLLMDSEKIGEACVSTLCSLDGIDYIICEKDISILYPLYKNKFILA